MGIFLRHSWNVKPPRWGSPADVQYAIKVNAEKIYDVDPDSIVLAMPLFWGLPALDYSGKNNHGTNHGATYKDGSLDFDGSNDYVDCGGGDSLDFTVNSTIAMWLYPNSTAAMYFISANTDEVESLLGIYQVSGKIYVPSAGYPHSVSGIGTGSWKHLVIIRYNDGSPKVNFYIDGSQITTEVQPADDLTTTPNSLFIGARIGETFLFNGIIDEVRISNVARTANQIALFHDLPWALYQPVSRPVYFFQAAEGGVSIPVAMQNMRGGFNPIGMRGGFINAD